MKACTIIFISFNGQYFERFQFWAAILGQILKFGGDLLLVGPRNIVMLKMGLLGPLKRCAEDFNDI